MIVLAGQAARWYLRLHMEWFWLVFGVVFAVSGILESLRLEIGEAFLPSGLLPVLLIVAGIALVASALLRKSQH